MYVSTDILSRCTLVGSTSFTFDLLMQPVAWVRLTVSQQPAQAGVSLKDRISALHR